MECESAGGGDIFFMRNPEDLSGRDGELLLFEYCEEHPPLVMQVSRLKNTIPVKDILQTMLKLKELGTLC